MLQHYEQSIYGVARAVTQAAAGGDATSSHRQCCQPWAGNAASVVQCCYQWWQRGLPTVLGVAAIRGSPMLLVSDASRPTTVTTSCASPQGHAQVRYRRSMEEKMEEEKTRRVRYVGAKPGSPAWMLNGSVATGPYTDPHRIPRRPD